MKKRAFTLLEIMIAILIITVITGAIGYNMRGALDKGKVFRTRQAKEQLSDLLQICVSQQPTKIGDIATNPLKYLEATGLAKEPQKLIIDGWGQLFNITVDNGVLIVSSEALINYEKAHPGQ